MVESIVRSKSFSFAVRIVNVYKFLKIQRNEHVLSKQLLRAGTSIGANLAESYCAVSDKDFLNKIYISLKEAQETLYWIKLLHETGYLTGKEYNSIYDDCLNIVKMLMATTKTFSSKLK